jgi:hypothetical protein
MARFLKEGGTFNSTEGGLFPGEQVHLLHSKRSRIGNEQISSTISANDGKKQR